MHDIDKKEICIMHKEDGFSNYILWIYYTGNFIWKLTVFYYQFILYITFVDDFYTISFK